MDFIKMLRENSDLSDLLCDVCDVKSFRNLNLLKMNADI